MDDEYQWTDYNKRLMTTLMEDFEPERADLQTVNLLLQRALFIYSIKNLGDEHFTDYVDDHLGDWSEEGQMERNQKMMDALQSDIDYR